MDFVTTQYQLITIIVWGVLLYFTYRSVVKKNYKMSAGLVANNRIYSNK